MHKKFKNAILASHYTEEKEKIDVLIETIKEKIALVDPLTLFNFLLIPIPTLYLFMNFAKESVNNVPLLIIVSFGFSPKFSLTYRTVSFIVD